MTSIPVIAAYARATWANSVMVSPLIGASGSTSSMPATRGTGHSTVGGGSEKYLMTGVDQAASQPVNDRFQSAVGGRGHWNPRCRNDPDLHEGPPTSARMNAGCWQCLPENVSPNQARETRPERTHR